MAAANLIKVQAQWLGHGDGNICRRIMTDDVALPLNDQKVSISLQGADKLLLIGLQGKQLFARPRKHGKIPAAKGGKQLMFERDSLISAGMLRGSPVWHQR